jgi:hypothetical protein
MTIGIGATAASQPGLSPTTGAGTFVFGRPPIIPSADQAYFWTAEWQRGEAEAEAELAAGDVVEFDSDDPNDVIRWLLDAED